MSIEVLKEELIKLSSIEKAEITHFMVELLTNEAFSLSEEWKKELDKREFALDNNLSIGQPARKVLEKYYQ